MARILLIVLFLQPYITYSQSDGMGYSFGAIFGSETTTVHDGRMGNSKTTRPILGLRLVVGVPMFSPEFEFTSVTDSRDYGSDDYEVEEETQRYMLGARTTLALGDFFGMWLRYGAQYSLTHEEIKDNGESSEDDFNKLDPYIGTGLIFGMNSFISLNVGYTFIFRDGFPFGKNQDAQLSLGFTFRP
jgi:hypothetical protein